MNRAATALALAGIVATGQACTSSSADGGGLSSFACNATTAGWCYAYAGISTAELSAEQTACIDEEMGTSVDTCPTDDLAGCCAPPADGYSVVECFYTTGGAYSADDVKAMCPDGGFTTQP